LLRNAIVLAATVLPKEGAKQGENSRGMQGL